VNEIRNVRQLNKDGIFDIIRHSPEGVSRAEIAEMLNVSRATVSGIVESLIADQLVLELGAGISRGGRRPIVLQVNPDAGRVVGIDIGATHVLAVLANLRGGVLAEIESSLDIAHGPHVCLPIVCEAVDALLQRGQTPKDSVLAFGIGVPGPVIAAHGIVSSPPIMPGWDGFPIRKNLETQWKIPTFVDNDADLGALGEATFGAGRGEPNLAYIKIGTGIGCGLLLEGKIYRGVVGTAGEIGHVTVSQDGPPCKCGNYGCLEVMAGGRAIAERAQMAVKAGQRTSLAALNHSHELTARDVAAAAKAGDEVSQQLLNDAGRHIGSALASLINLLNPGLIILGGRVTEAGAVILDPITDVVQKRSLRASYQASRIALSELGQHTTAMGAVALALDQAYARVRRGNVVRRSQPLQSPAL
jgi:glucokinase-like ROK family protein